MIEVVQRWSKYGDYTWGFLDKGTFYPFHVSKATTETALRNLGPVKPGYFYEDGWYSDDSHFVYECHPSELPESDPAKMIVTTQKPKAAQDGRFFRED